MVVCDAVMLARLERRLEPVLTLLWDLLMLLVCLALLPVLTCALGAVCFVPMLDRLLHPRREYMDGVSSAQVGNVEEAVIHGVFVSTERVAASTVIDNFRELYLQSGRPEFARWRHRAVRGSWLWPYWADAGDDFDPEHHLRSFPEPITKEELERSIGQIQTEPLDFRRPLWELRVYENFTDENGKACTATMLRMHHCMADGFTGMRVVLQGAEPRKPPADARPQERGTRKPGLSALQTFRFLIASVKKLLFMAPDKISTFKSSVLIGATSRRNVAWNSLRSGSVEDLKKLGKALGGATINDILLSALTGALRSYAEQSPSGGQVSDEVTTAVWVSLSPLRHMYTDFSELPLRWGNATLGACYMPLGVGPAHRRSGPRETLEHLRRSTGDPALMVEAGVATKLMSLFGWLPPVISRPVWVASTNKITVSMSNVPGPQFPMSWLGMPVRNMLFFVPPTGTVSVFVTIASFNGEVTVGMGVDGTLLEPEALEQITGKLFEEEIRKLRDAVPAAAS